jgi:hypothetical protein
MSQIELLQVLSFSLNGLSGCLGTKIPKVWYATTIIYLSTVDLYDLYHIEDFSKMHTISLI